MTTSEPRVIRYYPWQKSLGFHDAASSPDVDVAALVTGARYGKTYALLNEAIRQVLIHGHGARGTQERYLVIVIAPTYPMLRDIILPKWWMFWPEDETAKWSETEKKLIARNGAEIQFRSAEKIDRIRGSAPNLICLDEAREMTEYVFNLCVARVADRCGKVLISTTPNGYDWTYHSVEERARANPRIHCYHATAYDNPLHKKDHLDRLPDIIGDDLTQQEVFGRRVKFEGVVYKQFDPERHVDPLQYNKDFPLCLAIDFNINPISAALMHPIGTRRQWQGWQVFDEAVLKHSDTDELCQEILRRYPNHKGEIFCYPDPSGAYGHTSNRGRSDHAILKEYFGPQCVRAKKRAPFIRDRVAGLNRLFRSGHDDTSETLFYVDPRCEVLIKGLTTLGYKGNIPDEQAFEGHITAALGYAEAFERPFDAKGLQAVELLSRQQLRRKQAR